MVAERIAVLLMAYGGPGSLDDVEPYLLDVRGGRATSAELVHEIRERYRAIGGRSPILKLTEAQAEGLGRLLGPGFEVSVGMRHWHPFIAEAIAKIAAAGRRRLVGIAMAPHYSAMSVGAYEKKVLEAVAANGGQGIDVALVRSWGDHPGFIAAMRELVGAPLARFPSPRQVEVIFTAHSLPERILKQGDPYVEQLRASAAAVAARSGLGDHWRFAFQSAGRTPEPWLGPEVGAVITELAGQGRKEFLLVPIGFVCDHVEILYDIDVEYQALARSLGVRLERTASLNDSPSLLEVLADITRTAAAERGWIA